MTVKIEGKSIVITLELQPPAPSASGKTLVIATTRGNQPTAAQLDGKPVYVGVNAYVTR